MDFFPSSRITFDAALRDLQSRNSKVRAMAAHALGDVVDPDQRRRAAAALVEALRDERPEVRTEAAFSLGDLASETAVAPLADALGDPVPTVRQGAAMALGKLGFSAGFEPLAHALREGRPDVRFQAATSLVEIDAARAYQPLVEALADEDSEVIGAAALGLGTIGDARAIELLAPLLEHPKRRTRLDVAYALAQLGDRRAAPILIEYVGDEELGWDAMEALEMLGDPSAADALAPLLERKLAPPLLLHAASTLHLLAPQHPAIERARQVLLAGLRLRKLEQRGLAVQLLGKVGGEWAADALADLRQRRAGRHLQEDIDEALGRLAQRAG